MQIMTSKILLLTALTCGLSSAAYAQDTGNSAGDTAFVKADKNKDNNLSRSEFKRFTALMAEAGDTEYTAINKTEYEHLHFSGKDINRDGLLTQDELAYKVILNDKPAAIKPSYGSSNDGEILPSTDTPADDNAPSEIEPTEE